MNKDLFYKLAKAKVTINKYDNMNSIKITIEKLLADINNQQAEIFLVNSFNKLSDLYNSHIEEYKKLTDNDSDDNVQKEGWFSYLSEHETKLFKENASKLIDIALNRYVKKK